MSFPVKEIILSMSGNTVITLIGNLSYAESGFRISHLQLVFEIMHHFAYH